MRWEIGTASGNMNETPGSRLYLLTAVEDQLSLGDLRFHTLNNFLTDLRFVPEPLTRKPFDKNAPELMLTFLDWAALRSRVIQFTSIEVLAPLHSPIQHLVLSFKYFCR